MTVGKHRKFHTLLPEPIYHYFYLLIIRDAVQLEEVHRGHKACDHPWYIGAAFKRLIIDAKDQGNISHTIKPQPATWISDTKQDEFILSCCLCQILALLSGCRNRNRDSSDQVMFFQSSIVRVLWPLANCRLGSYPTGIAPNVVFYWSQSTSRVDVLCVCRDALLYTFFFVKSCYLHYCCIYIRFNQYNHSPPTYFMKEGFCPQKRCSLKQLFFPLTVLCKPYRWLCVKLRIDQ